MKTVMQELVDFMKQTPMLHAGILLLIKDYDLLEKERQQIIESHIAGQKFASDNDNPDSEEYYKSISKPHQQ